jgi:D-alanine-D-alanine ligase
MKILILYNKISQNPTEDELDVLEEVKLVSIALEELNHGVITKDCDMNLERVIEDIKDIQPDLIFNLVESMYNKGEFAYLSTSVLNYLNIPFTGNQLIPLFVSSNKILSKKELIRLNIPTPEYYEIDKLHKLNKKKKYIIKPIWEEGSLELDENCIFNGSDKGYIKGISGKNKNYYFVEEFIDGREFNVSIIGTDNGPKVLPIAEMTFNFPEDKPKIMGYKSKWDENSFEYLNTERTFNISNDNNIKGKIKKICKKCWNEIGFRGYVRIDFRLDSKNNPYVIDLNLNPCISGSGGFYAACKKSGFTYTTMIDQIIKEALK